MNWQDLPVTQKWCDCRKRSASIAGDTCQG